MVLFVNVDETKFACNKNFKRIFFLVRMMMKIYSSYKEMKL